MSKCVIFFQDCVKHALRKIVSDFKFLLKKAAVFDIKRKTIFFKLLLKLIYGRVNELK